MLLLGAVVLRNPGQTFRLIQVRKPVLALYSAFVFSGIITLCLNIADGAAPFNLAAILTVLISPLAMVSGLRISSTTFFKILSIALIVVDLYALLQFLLGITSTSIPGVTYTYGQSLEQKPIGYTDTGVSNKMPSTYQNGNYLGIFDALGIGSIITWTPSTKKWAIARYSAIFTGIIGLLLCGSRSIVLPFVVVVIFIFAQRFRLLNKNAQVTALVSSALLLILITSYIALFQSEMIAHFVNRIFLQTFSDSTGAGRTTQWKIMANSIQQLDFPQTLRFFTFGADPQQLSGGEGLPEFVRTFGVLGGLLFYGLLLSTATSAWRTPHTRPSALVFICVIVAFCVDSSFYYFPNVLLYFLFFGNCLRHQYSAALTDCSSV
jgi:hypothetical protein